MNQSAAGSYAGQSYGLWYFLKTRSTFMAAFASHPPLEARIQVANCRGNRDLANNKILAGRIV